MIDILRKSIEMSNDSYSVFLYGAPHCKMFSISTHWGGWKEGQDATHDEWFFYSENESVTKYSIDEAIIKASEWIDNDFLEFTKSIAIKDSE